MVFIINYNNAVICDGWTVSNIKNEFIKMTSSSYAEIINETPVILDTRGLLGELNAGLLFDVKGTHREFEIYYRQNSEMPEHLIKSLFHEITHLIDYHEFVKHFNHGIYDGYQFNKEEYPYFLIWSEFHASYKCFKHFITLFCDVPNSDYLEQLFEFEISLVYKMNKTANVTTLKQVLRFIARLYLFSLYEGKYGNVSNLDLGIVEIIEFFSSHSFDVTFELFKTLGDFNKFYLNHKNFISHIREYRNIQAIEHEMELYRRF